MMMAIALSYSLAGTADKPAGHLIDRASKRTSPTAPTSAPTTIHAAGKTMLARLGIWPLLEQTPTPIHWIKVAEARRAMVGLAHRQKAPFRLDWHDETSQWPMLSQMKICCRLLR